ncbi:MAG TPA: ATP-binding protein [Ktedonobacterales bacterium]|nr:ATP-binding protein [Ktedonobacterales bacterium]
MWLFEKPLTEVTEQDLQALVASAFEEGVLVDYKETLPGNSDKDRFDLRADVVAFANTTGGLLIYGMREVDGKASELVGLEDINTDAEILRLENTILAGVQPRIKVATHPITLGSGRTAIVMRIPRSWIGPHAVVREDWLRFVMRGSKGNQYMDVRQVHAATIGAESAIEHVRAFRADRLIQVMSNETPVPLAKGPRMILHVVPLNVFTPGISYDVVGFASDSTTRSLITPPGVATYADRRYNLDGVVAYGSNGSGAMSYLQLFRNGAIEVVDLDAVAPVTSNRMRLIPTAVFERNLIVGLPSMLRIQKRLSVELPLVIMLTLTGVQEMVLAVPGGAEGQRRYAIERDVLMMPEILVNDFEVDAAQALKPVVDALWNAGGYAGSPNYRDGVWISRG